MENLIEELTKVNPSNLSEEGLKLFNKINEIIDRNEELGERNKIYALNGDNINLELHIKNNYIPKSLIKEKIEELKERLRYYQSLELPEVDSNGIRTGLIVDKTIMILKAKIQVLEEILKGENNE